MLAPVDNWEELNTFRDHNVLSLLLCLVTGTGFADSCHDSLTGSQTHELSCFPQSSMEGGSERINIITETMKMYKTLRPINLID
ncbi:hypothetical protein Hanom_Chr09g00778351 [Helianthus anomalus]